MQFTSIALLALAGFVAAESGFTVPEGQAEGVYTVYRRADGSEHHQAVDTQFSAKFARAAVSEPSPAVNELTRRDWTPAVTCGGGAALNAADTDKANAMLDAQCGSSRNVGDGLHIYSISGGTVAYYCNFDSFGMPHNDGVCANWARQQASKAITDSCKPYVPGWQEWKNPPVGLSTETNRYSYGYQAATDKFCGCGTKC